MLCTERRNFKRAFATAPRAPVSARHNDRAPDGPRQEGLARLGRKTPSTTRLSWRDAERGRRLNAGERQTRANARSEGGATERPVRLL